MGNLLKSSEKQGKGVRYAKQPLTWNDILLRAHEIAHSHLLHVRELLLEVIGQSERDDRKTGIKSSSCVAFSRSSANILVDGRFVESEDAFLPMNIAHARVPAGCLKGVTEEPSILHAILHDVSETIETEVNEVEVLSDDLSSRPGEVEGIALFSSTQVVKLKDEVLWKIRLIAPYDPAYARVHKAKLMAARVDGLNTRQFKVPLEAGLGVRERGDEGARSTIDMDRNVMSGFGLEIIQNVRNLLDWFVMARIGRLLKLVQVPIGRTVHTPRMTKTPMVFSSMFSLTNSGSSLKRLFSDTGRIRASTSK